MPHNDCALLDSSLMKSPSAHIDQKRSANARSFHRYGRRSEYPEPYPLFFHAPGKIRGRAITVVPGDNRNFPPIHPSDSPELRRGE